jgi:hypothetical protein
MLDPYHRWLAIPRGRRPPTYYELLGVDPDEADPEVIAEAALRQTSHVRTYQTGPYAEQCTALLNEIAQARATLTHPERRREYDTRLGRGRRPSDPEARPADGSPTVPVPPAAVPPDSVSAPPPAANPFNLFALAYVVVLLLGGLLAFRLGSASRRSAVPAATAREPDNLQTPLQVPGGGKSRGGE